MRLSILVACFLLVTSTLQAKIVFRSSRDGNSEIYVMSSFGNGQMRLTDYDGDDVAPPGPPTVSRLYLVKFCSIEKGIGMRRFM